MRIRTLLVALAALAALVLAGCGNGEPVADDGDDGDVVEADGVVEVDVSMQDIEFVPDTVEVPAGSQVVFNLTNDGNLEHDLMFDDGTDSGVVPAGGSATLEAGPFTSDTVGWCDIPGHREAGMELEVLVTD